MKKTSEDGVPGKDSRDTRATGFDRFLSAFSLVSRLPVRRSFFFDPSRLDFHLPLVGLPVSLLAAATMAAAMRATASPTAAAFAVLAVQYLAFNLFHLDGLLDTADAFLGPGDAQKRLAILKDSRIGVFAFFAGFMALAAKLALLLRVAGLGPDSGNLFGLAAVLAYPIAGRAAAALVPALAPPAGETGLGALAKGSKASRVLAGSLAGIIPWAALSMLLPSLFAPVFPAIAAASPFEPLFLLGWACIVPSAIIPAVFFARMYRRGVGGYTGDALGAAVESGELLHLALSLAALGAAGAV